jgi:hypothetical protein
MEANGTSCNLPAKDELLQKIGRNLILFQKIEHVLKGLVALGAFNASSSGTVKPADPVLKQSLGLVAAAFIQRHLVDWMAEPEVNEDDVVIHTSFRIDGPTASELSAMLLKAIPDRNCLAHHLVVDFDVYDGEGRSAAVAWLDKSFHDHSPLLATLVDHHQSFRLAFRQILSFLQSKEGINELFLPDIQEAPVVQELVRAAAKPSSADGWTYLVEAARSISGTEVRQTLGRFGMKSLTELLAASRLFELRAEETPSGGTRMMIRSSAGEHPLQGEAPGSV